MSSKAGYRNNARLISPYSIPKPVYLLDLMILWQKSIKSDNTKKVVVERKISGRILSEDAGRGIC